MPVSFSAQNSVSVTNLTGFNHYQYTYEVTDIFGNFNSRTSAIDYTAPATPAKVNSKEILENMNGKVKLRWKNNDDFDVIKIGYEEYGKTKAEPSICVEGLLKKIECDKDISLYRNGKRYTFDIYAVDYSGNKSIPLSIHTRNYINDKGNIVYDGTEITYTAMAPVLTKSTEFHTIAKPNYAIEDIRGTFTDDRGSNVTLDPYEMGKYLVTNRLYNLVSGTTIMGLSSDPRWPICGATYYHAIIFCNRLSIMLGFTPCYSFGDYSVDAVNEWTFWNVNGQNMDITNAFKDLKCDFGANGFRLPTELEWECCGRGADETKWEWKNCYAAKTDSIVAYYYKDGGMVVDGIEPNNYLNTLPDTTKASIYLIYDWVGNVCSYNRGSAYDVGLFAPTSTGQYDMSGLLCEWCWDTYDTITSGSSIYGKVNYSRDKVQGNINTNSYDAVHAKRVVRGGCFQDTDTNNFKVYNRNSIQPHASNSSEINFTQIGFRLCRTITE